MNFFLACISRPASIGGHKRLPGGNRGVGAFMVAGGAALLLAACASSPDAGARRQLHIKQGDLAMLEVRDRPSPHATEAAVFTTPTGVLFAAGQAELEPSAEARLKQLSVALAQNPNRHIVLEGHADSAGSDQANQQLSQRRAEVVWRYLTAQGIAADRIDMAARGETKPVASNGSEAGRQQNRRVDIVIQK